MPRPGKILFALSLLVAALFASLFVFLHPPQKTPERSWPSKAAFGADARAGYYRHDDGAVRLALPGAYSGYVLYSTENLGAAQFKVVGAGATALPEGPPEKVLTFTDKGYVLFRPDGTQVSATRIRPQPFSVRDISATRDKVRLSGWLLTPRRSGGVGVVIVHGSGSSDRDNAWYVTLAARLARAGAVVLLPDKRGAGRSGGHWWHADYERLAGDAAAWLRLLQREAPGLERSGYVGVSQGGRVAPIAAARYGAADFVAILSAAAIPQNEQLRHEIEADARGRGLPDWLARLAAPLFAERVRNRRPGWWRAVGSTDPVAEWRAAKVPLFVAYGAKDEDDNVPVARSVLRLRHAFGNDPRIRLRVYEGVGHGYIVEARRTILPRFLEDLTGWLNLDAGAAAKPFHPDS